MSVIKKRWLSWEEFERIAGGTWTPASHSHVRTDITDFWNSPFWANIPDKPSSFTPSAHASTHHSGGSDALAGQSIAGLTTASSPTFAGLDVTGLTDNYIPYVGVGALANSPIYTDGTKVGIGTTGPTNLLYVEKSVADYLLYIGNSNTAGGGILTSAGSASLPAMRIRNKDSTDLFYVGGGGNVGVGTTSPAQKLDVNGNVKGSAYYLGSYYLNTLVANNKVYDSDQIDGVHLSGLVQTSRSISTTSPLAGGGNLSVDRTFSLAGLSTLGTANYLVGVKAAANAWEYKHLIAGQNIGIAYATGEITISASGIAVGYHNLLDGDVHPDTIQSQAVIGDMVFADETTGQFQATCSPTGAESALPGDVAWTNPTYIYNIDSTFATAAILNQVTQRLRGYTFGFNIPSGATIVGIKAEILRNMQGVEAEIQDYEVYLLKAGSEIGIDKATADYWPLNNDAFMTYGGSSDLWGTTWTPAEINASGFGLSLRAAEVGGVAQGTARVNFYRITVYYTATGAKWNRFAGNITTTKKYLAQVGDGSKAGDPFWDVVTGVPPAEHGNEAHNPDFSAVGHGHVRGDISDFWSTPFWSSIPDKPSSFTPSAHTLVDSYHTASGLTPGHFLKALTSTTFGFAVHGLSYGDVGAAASSHTHLRSQVTDFWATPFWASIPDKPSSFTPSAHASTHHSGGGDALAGQSIAGLTTVDSPTFAGLDLTGLTDGYIPYVGVGAMANSPIYTDGTNVGIGTTGPGAKLDVNGNIRLSASNPTLDWGGNTLTLRQSGDAIGVVKIIGGTTYHPRFEMWGPGGTTQYVMLRTSGDSYFTGGNVGIGGTDAESMKLRVYGNVKGSAYYLGSYYMDTLAANNKVYDSQRWENFLFPSHNANEVLGLNNANNLIEAKAITGGTGVKITHAANSISIAITGFVDMSMFGDGVDGDVTITQDTTLTRDMCYNSLTVNAGYKLNTAGYRIFVATTLVVQAGAAICCDGGNGGNGDTSGGGGTAGTAPYSSARAEWSIPRTGRVGGHAPDIGTSNGTQASASSSTIAVSSVAPIIVQAGGGGSGGAAHGLNPENAWPGYAPWCGAVGGIGGAGAGSGSCQLGGGGGGAGGGVLIINANTMNNGGTIRANGGNGGSGAVYSVTKAGNGGGGGGGAVLITYRYTAGSGLGTLQANGGSAGTNGNGGTAGSNGITASFQVGA